MRYYDIKSIHHLKISYKRVKDMDGMKNKTESYENYEKL